METLQIAFSEQPDESAADEEIDNVIGKNMNDVPGEDIDDVMRALALQENARAEQAPPLLLQLVDNVTAAAPAGAPNLRHLATLHHSFGDVSKAELDALRRLSRLEALELSTWEFGPYWTTSNRWDDFSITARDFRDADLARLLAGLPRLRHLSLALH